ncbi:MAG: HIT domain-containing protein [Pseudomonadota bacterium]
MPHPNCRFCRANSLLADAPVAETAHHYLLASMDPDMTQAVMVIPNRHRDSPFEITAEEWTDLAAALAAAKAHLAQYSPEGYTMGWNVGALAGQTVGHVHLHVIARHAGDAAHGQGIRNWLKRAWAGVAG